MSMVSKLFNDNKPNNVFCVEIDIGADASEDMSEVGTHSETASFITGKYLA